jgi:hypothetical protein
VLLWRERLVPNKIHFSNKRLPSDVYYDDGDEKNKNNDDDDDDDVMIDVLRVRKHARNITVIQGFGTTGIS